MFMRGSPYNYPPVLLLTAYCRSYFGVTTNVSNWYVKLELGNWGKYSCQGIITLARDDVSFIGDKWLILDINYSMQILMK